MRRIVVPVLCVLLVLALVPPANGTGEHPQLSAEPVQRNTPVVVTPGVSRETIKIGLHAPLTGAAPVPSDSIEKGKDLYFRWLAGRGVTINGRDVRVILKNDNYNPSSAVTVCREMIKQNNVFMLTGFTGADQTHACARFAESVGAPYAAPGAQTQGMKLLEHYFSTSTPWPRQARLLADFLIAKKARREENGIVYFGTPSHDQAANRFEKAMTERNATVDYSRAVSRAAGAAEARVVIEEMEALRIDNAFV
ncbi:MAG: ABC transporter substrate-binding protein, partial [Actinomycetota bacterium]|nr:ABC transporter substrate-binding protein [Actinomycetota bacterium]